MPLFEAYQFKLFHPKYMSQVPCDTRFSCLAFLLFMFGLGNWFINRSDNVLVISSFKIWLKSVRTLKENVIFHSKERFAYVIL